MKLSREMSLNLLALALLAGLALWVASRTEWVDVLVATRPRGEAETDNFYAAKQLLRRLGARVSAPDNLDRFPPPGATLVLVSPQWNLFPERDAQLKRWVEGGGHLVLPNFTWFGDEIEWVPISQLRRKVEDDDKATNPRPAAASAPAFVPRPTVLVGPSNEPKNICPPLQETTELPGAFGAARSYRLCSVVAFTNLQAKQAAQWSVNDAHGAQLLRVGVGRGSVTALNTYNLLDNGSLFAADHALAVVAALRPGAGREIWFVVNEARDALPLWLWQRAGPAIALGLLALALALWRGAMRFGPLAPQPPLARRSVAEQIRGTAAFVLRRGGAPLLAASRRALDKAARKRLPGLDRMGLGERAAAIAKAVDLPAEALQRALDTRLAPTRRELPDRLALLETARRRLDAGVLLH